MNPAISIVTAVYNQAPYLSAAIKSVLRQTFHDFEFIIINDGSTDSSGNVIRRFSDPRIRHVTNETNIKLPASLNRGIRLARGKYIIRFDSDDICYRRRLAEQFKFMEAHPDVDVCGSWLRYFGDRLPYRVKPSTDPDVNRCLTLFASPVAHPTVIFRKSTLDELGLEYDPKALHAEDYDLLLRGSLRLRTANIPKCLLWYRTHPAQVTRAHADVSAHTAREAQRIFMTKIGLPFSERDLEIHAALGTYRFPPSDHLADEVEEWLMKVEKWNEQTRTYPANVFATVILDRWMRAASRFPRGSGATLSQILRSSPGRKVTVSWPKRIKYHVVRSRTLRATR